MSTLRTPVIFTVASAVPFLPITLTVFELTLLVADVTVTASLPPDVTISTEPVSAQGVTPVTYIKRGDGTVIVLKVTYRKNKWIVSLIDFFGVSADTTSDFQTVSESTTSERW